MSSECQFSPFSLAPEICDRCGEPREDHYGLWAPNPMYTEYDKAMWLALVKHGGPPNAFHDYDFNEAVEIRMHLGLIGREEVKKINRDRYYQKFDYPDEFCEIDWDKTHRPLMSTVGEFDGTDCDNREVPAVTGILYCKCGDLYSKWIVLKNKTMSQLIWLVVKEGEINE